MRVFLAALGFKRRAHMAHLFLKNCSNYSIQRGKGLNEEEPLDATAYSRSATRSCGGR